MDTGLKIKDNVKVILRDENGKKTRIFTSHNTPLNYALSAFAKWIGGVNNFGFNPTSPPSQIQLGSGVGTPSPSDTGLFTPIANTLKSLSYAQTNTPSNGVTTFVFQISAGIVTTQVTEALMRDTSGNGWFHTMFPAPFTPASTENITVQWEVSFSV